VDLGALKGVTEPAFPDLKWQYSGYLSVGSQAGSALGFIFSGAQSAASLKELETKPILLWMNGGPGSSSQLGNFYELGRVRLTGLTPDKKWKIENNSFAWDANYSVIFLDQPLGTGLSNDAADAADLTSSVAQSTEHLYYALNEFFAAPTGCARVMNISAQKTPFFIFG
jgi:vitellogenic carboxypeptidase-like protein